MNMYPRPAAELNAGNGVCMQLITPDDKDLFYDAISHDAPHLDQDGGWASQVTPELADIMVTTMVNNAKDGRSAPYKLLSSRERPDEFVGVLNLFHRIGPTIGMGFWVIQRAEGQGIVTAAGVTAIDYAFEHLGVETVWAEANQGNQRSIATLGRIGLAKAADQASRDPKNPDLDKIVFEVHRSGR